MQDFPIRTINRNEWNHKQEIVQCRGHDDKSKADNYGKQLQRRILQKGRCISADNSSVSEPPSETMQTTTVDEQEYYLIKTENDLLSIGKLYPLSGNYMLDDNITLSGEWKSIGNEDEPFTGTFDGNEYR